MATVRASLVKRFPKFLDIFKVMLGTLETLIIQFTDQQKWIKEQLTLKINFSRNASAKYSPVQTLPVYYTNKQATTCYPKYYKRFIATFQDISPAVKQIQTDGSKTDHLKYKGLSCVSAARFSCIVNLEIILPRLPFFCL